MKQILTLLFILILAIFTLTLSPPESKANMAFYVMPPNYTNTAGTASFLGPLSNAQRTYQLLIHDTLLNDIDGKEITAISWRLLASATANWPPADLTYADYDIYLSASVAPQDRSLTFAQNIVGVQKKVRSGALNIVAGSYPSGGSPNQFGPEITFDSAYLYNGGHLLIEIRHSVSTGTSTSTDAIGTSTAGYGTLFSACWQSSYTATTGLQGNFSIVRITANEPTKIKPVVSIANDFSLIQNYPNPFNPKTNISIEMRRQGKATLRVYDITGNEVSNLAENRLLNAGRTNFIFDASNLPSGAYFYTLTVDGEKIDTKKMMLIK